MTTIRNTANLLELAELIDHLADWDDPNAGEGADRYNQDIWGHQGTCGTQCCIAGWEMVRLYGDDAFVPDASDLRTWFGPDDEPVIDHAAASLGLTVFESHILFSGVWRAVGARGANDPHATATALRNLAAGWPMAAVTDPRRHDEISEAYGFPENYETSMVVVTV